MINFRTIKMKSLKLFLFVYLLAPLLLIGQTTQFQQRSDRDQLISKGSEWKYLDDGSDQGTAWQSEDFDDNGWSAGPAQLGFGDGDESTVLNNDSYITFYFRKTFQVDSPDQSSNLAINLLRDDGAVIYINGEEVVRSNMPDGTITYTTLSAATVGDDENDYHLSIFPSSVLKSGENTIAVEIHQASTTSSDVSFEMEMDFVEVSLFRKAPYLLYTGENIEMLLIWQLHETKVCDVVWGTDETYSLGSTTTEEYGDSHQHKITFTDLSPGTKYFYKITVDDSDIKTGSFFSGASDSEEKVSFYAYGDTRTYPKDHDLVAEKIMEDIAANPETQTFIVSSGDFVADGNNEADWDEQFFDPQYENIQQLLSHLPYVAAIGNHEGQGLLFEKYFPYPMFSTSRYYYSFDYGPFHFISIDQYTSYSVGSTQYNWLVNDLESSDKDWKIFIFHEPGWSAGGHDNNMQVQEVIQPLCITYGVQLVITGHNHYYSRADVDGVMHITTGGGGAPLYNVNSGNDNIVIAEKAHHYCKIELSENILNFSAIRKNGTVIETFEVNMSKPPETGFIADTTEIIFGGSVNFTDITTNYPTSWLWAFEGGEPATSTLQNPTVVYNSPGIYNVVLYTENEAGSDMLRKSEMITVFDPSGINPGSANDDGLKVSNYPNPLTETTTVNYTIVDKSEVTLCVYDLHGEIVDVLVNKTQQKGNYSLKWDASNVSSGTYIFKLQTDSQTVVQKFIIK